MGLSQDRDRVKGEEGTGREHAVRLYSGKPLESKGRALPGIDVKGGAQVGGHRLNRAWPKVVPQVST